MSTLCGSTSSSISPISARVLTRLKSAARFPVPPASSTSRRVAGGSRIGDINSPVLVGGGRVFGPRPRDYRFKLNKKVKALARKSALTSKVQDNQIIVVEDFTFEAPKTKEFVNFAKNLQVADKKVLLVLADQNKNVYLSARNVPVQA